MKIALIGLGRMGHNMAERLMKDKHYLVVYDPIAELRKNLVKLGATPAVTLSDLKHLLDPPRIAWVMVPHGKAVNDVINELMGIFEKNDIIVDGGNSHYLESIEHNNMLLKKGIKFLDVGVSGGIFGLLRGYCLMIGGDLGTSQYLEPIFSSLAPSEDSVPPTKSRHHNYSSANKGFYYCGKSGAGHYVKMVHNAIEYGIMQSFAEGLGLLKNTQSFELDIREICELWRRGSVIGSWLLDLLSDALHKDPTFSQFRGEVPDSGEGRWALIEAINQGTPCVNLANSLFTRFRSREQNPFAEKALSALRKEFGGHQEAIKETKK